VSDLRQTFDEIRGLDDAANYEAAQAIRERILTDAETRSESDLSTACQMLVEEKNTFYGIDSARRAEPFYRRLLSVMQANLKGNPLLAARAKRKLGRVLVIEGKYDEAIGLVREAAKVFETRLQKNHWDYLEAVHCLLEWSKYGAGPNGPALAEAIWKKHSLCEHLKPVEQILLDRGAKLTWRHLEKGIGPRAAMTMSFNLKLDLEKTRNDLALDPCVEIFREQDRDGEREGFRCALHGDRIDN
jgi:hypothetical protein